MKQGLNFKRFFASLMLLAVSTLSWAYDFEVNGIYYHKNSDGMSVTVTYKTWSDRGYSGSVVIPSFVTFDNTRYSVTSIGQNAFNNCSGLTSVTMGNSVTSIGQYAFNNCSGLTSVTMGNSVTSIAGYAFYNCSGLTSVTIGNSVTSIGHYAFYNCSGLTSVTMGNSVTSIGQYAFYNCSGLKSITIPDGVKSIDKYVFYNCSGLTSVTIPESVTSIGNNAFRGCSGLTSVTIPESVTSIDENAFYDCSGLTSITIPNNVTSIGKYVFYNCSGLTSISIPEGVTSIGEYAFQGCSNLTSITIPESVTSIGEYAFQYTSLIMAKFASIESLCKMSFGNKFSNPLYYAKHLYVNGEEVKDLVIPNNVTSIGQYAFYGCSGLTSVTIPNSVTSIGQNAFYGCSGLTSVVLNSNTLVSKAYFPSSNLGTIFGSQVTNYVIGNDVTSIGQYAFYNCSGLTSVTMGNSVTSIGIYAFDGCSGLTSITIPNSVTSIGNNAFRGCSGLTKAEFASIESLCKMSFGNNFSNPLRYARNLFINGSEVTDVVIPNSVTSIGDYAFHSCSGLTSVTIGNSVTSIGDYAFSGCTSLPIDNNLRYADTYLVEAVDKTQNSYIIKDGTRFIGSSAFSGCSSLTSITIPNSVTSLENSVFERCSSLTSVTIGNSVTSIGNSAFYYCSGLTSITIPNSVTSIGEGAFNGCSGLTKAEFANIESLCKMSFGNNFSNPLRYARNLFINGSEVTDVVIPNSVTSIGDYAFHSCSGLASVTIPESVTSIGQYAFYGCSGLTSIDIPNSVTSIGYSAFCNCSGLTSITIPNSVTSIGYSAFENCAEIKEIICRATTVPNIYNDTFSGVDKTIPVYVPTASVASYKAASCWSEFAKILGGGEHIYIETDLTSQFPTDYLGWNGATGYTPKEFAPMVTTNDGRTVQVCEKFNDSVAETGTVFSRTLSGLTNGTYCIELYGAAASTKGRDTNLDTNMTAADEGNTTAVYLYAKTADGTVKQYIPVHWAISFSEVATAVLNNVVVTDGTVEIGMYSQKKFTNWEVIQIKGVTAMVDAEEFHASTLQRAQAALADEAFVNVTGVERTALSQAIADNSIVVGKTVKQYQTAITALENATQTFVEAKTNYDAWVNIINRTYPYATAEKKSAAESAASVLPTSARDALSKAESLKPLFRRYAESSAMLEGVEGAEDVTTTYIRNPKAEKAIDANVWQMVLGQGSDGYINIYTDQPWTDASGSTYHKYFDGGQFYESAWDVTLKQDITLLAGRYQLTAMGRSSQDVTLTLFAGEATAEMAHINATGGLFNRGWEQTSVEFELMQKTTVSIGVRGVTNVINNWMSFSDFRLVRFPGCILSGKCGNNVNFVLSHDYILTISGTGDMFDYNVEALPWEEYKNQIRKVVIEDGVTSIGVKAFYNYSGLTSVVVPESVTSIGNSAFSGCSGLTSVVVPNSVTNIGEMAFLGCTSLPIENNLRYADTYLVEAVDKTQNTYVIKDGTRFIGSDAFSACSNLTSINIPESVTSIGKVAFADCSVLTSVTIPNSVVNVDDYAFYSCSGLTSVTIPNSVTSIGNYAFEYCSNLTSVTCLAENVPTTGSGVFSGVPQSTATLYVPAGSVNAYKAASQWKEFGTIKAYDLPDATSVALNKTETTLAVGAKEQLTATVLPEEAEQTVTWTSSDPGVATVDENGLVTAVATGVAIITATTTDGTRLTATCEVTVEDPAIPGDVNGDGNVNGADIVAVINYVLADDIAGDVNGDGNVNGADIVAVINYVLNDSGNNARQAVAQSRAAAAEEPAEILSGTKTDEGISLSLTGGEDCTAFQFMLSLPEGASLTAVTGSEERLGDHELLFRRQQDGRYLVLGFAMDNRCIGESSGELLSLQLTGNANGRAIVSEALIFTPQAETRYMNALEIDLPTVVSGVRAKDAVEDGDIYDLNGRKLNKKPSSGYYIQGGKKYFVK